MEHYQPYFQKRTTHVAHSLRNLLLAATNIILSICLFIFLLHHIFRLTQIHQLGLLNYLKMSDLWTFVIAIILIDLWQYYWHRLNHRLPFLWRFHSVHHADKELDASSGVRFHPGEILLSSMARLLIIPLLGINLNHLLTYEIIMMTIVFFHHSNIKLNETIDRILRIIIITPHIHRLHHSDQKTETDSNYGNIFSFWDRIFNSYTMRSIEKNFSFGLGGKFNDKEWNSYSGMLKMPLKKNT
jgi:sterol desaturase/sphingolipid hydroxylase (fatty acid hydroxylase superfamily)